MMFERGVLDEEITSFACQGLQSIVHNGLT
jgi:hypothetical protein